MSFDFSNEENVDCLICHDQTRTYVKDPKGAGYPDKSVDLLAVAGSVGRPQRQNCGVCHFRGGGGDAVKHGDLDDSLLLPSSRVDVHMGLHGLSCRDCHRTEHHQIPGSAMSVTPYKDLRVGCTDCHDAQPHADERIDGHLQTVACQSCHIPIFAVDGTTKMSWDWSQAGKDATELKRDNPKLFRQVMEHWEDPNPGSEISGTQKEKRELEFFMDYLIEHHLYMKIKGIFTHASRVTPTYGWYNGKASRYLMGDKIEDPSRPVTLARPLGSIRDPNARIFPFKIHHAVQIYDEQYKYLLYPKLAGEGGFWNDFDWELACELGAEASKLEYSGNYGWVSTTMWWPIDHMIARKEMTLQCVDCHGSTGRMDWTELGYDGDPAFTGTRFFLEMPLGCEDEKP